MKKFLNQFLIIAALIIVGCSDPCKDVLCGPGTCDDGTCICPEGYEGTACETLENEKYFGLYTSTEFICDGAAADGIRFEIEANSEGDAFAVNLELVFDGAIPIDFEGTIKNGKVDVSIGNVATIKGDITGTTFVGVYAVLDSDSCDFTAVK